MPLLTDLIGQNIHTVPSFGLENRAVPENSPVASKTGGKLKETYYRVTMIRHKFTGSADVEDWQGLLMGRNKAFVLNQLSIFWSNVHTALPRLQ
ncbi:hypothetical protein BKA70DRAFT_376228 [Coprinopsis sp. MPI-PUGE-AT-0042]|nr:hypothetical protein BKA70DRAFT_376228 [Coprinopsis sp. MPI-PUGE-AT-0042]